MSLLKHFYFVIQMETSFFFFKYLLYIWFSLHKSGGDAVHAAVRPSGWKQRDHATGLTHGGSEMFLTCILQLEEEK